MSKGGRWSATLCHSHSRCVLAAEVQRHDVAAAAMHFELARAAGWGVCAFVSRADTHPPWRSVLGCFQCRRSASAIEVARLVVVRLTSTPPHLKSASQKRGFGVQLNSLRADGVYTRWRRTRRQVHILKFEGYNNPEEAFEALVGRTLLVDANDRPALDDDEDMTYFVSDLIGMHCVNLVRPPSGEKRPLGCWEASFEGR